MTGFNALRPQTCDEVRELAGAYVLGALDSDELATVRAHLAAGHAEAHPEIAELGSVIPAMFETVPIVEPPAGLKQRIMAAAAAELAARADASVPASAAAERAAPTAPPVASSSAPIAFPSEAERAARRRPTTGTWLLRIAAVFAIAVLGGWNLLLQNQLGASQAYERNVAAVIAAGGQPGAVTAVLTADGGPGSGLAAVDAAGQLTIAMRDLEPTSGSTVYEAWSIGADGVPVPLGSFQVGSSRVGFFQASGVPAAEGIVLALTHEAGPGATTPTMPIISKGVAGAPG